MGSAEKLRYVWFPGACVVIGAGGAGGAGGIGAAVGADGAAHAEAPQLPAD